MKRHRFLAALVLCIGVPALAFAQGGAVQRDTKLAVSEPTQVGTILLDPGSYTLRVHDFKGGKVQVTVVRDSDQKTVGTATAIRARRNLDTNQQAENQTQFTYTTYNGHPAVSTWYYPGDEWGEQFIYGGSASEMTMRHTPAPAAPTATMAESTPPPPPPAVKERHEEKKMVEAAPAPAPAPVAAVEPAPAPAAAPAPAPKPKARALPKTASSTPLVALLGALSLAGAAAVRFGRRRAA
jgi:LPXTG-motif cell wall-anchored protein